MMNLLEIVMKQLLKMIQKKIKLEIVLFRLLNSNNKIDKNFNLKKNY